MVAMETYNSYRIIIGKIKTTNLLLSLCRYLNFVICKMFIEYSSIFHMPFVLITYFDWLLGPDK